MDDLNRFQKLLSNLDIYYIVEKEDLGCYIINNIIIQDRYNNYDDVAIIQFDGNNRYIGMSNL